MFAEAQELFTRLATESSELVMPSTPSLPIAILPIFDTLITSIVQLDPQGYYIAYNRYWATLLRVPHESLHGANIRTVFDPSPHGIQWVDLAALAHRSRSGSVQLSQRLRRHDGSSLWVSLALTTMRDQHGNVSSFLAVMLDVTEQVETEQNLRQRLRELNALRMAMNDIADKLELEDLLPTILRHAADLMHATNGEISLYNSVQQTFQLNSQINMGAAYTGLHDLLSPAELCELHRTREPYLVQQPDHDKDQRTTLICFPLIHNEQLHGILTLGFKAERIMIRSGELGLLHMFVRQAATSIANAFLFAEVQRLATTDTLMDIYNRRHFLLLAERIYIQAQQQHTPLAILMIDIDHFKLVNDQYGHQVGDQVLQQIATLIEQLVRAEDMCGRYGGEELILLLPHTGVEQAQVVAERIRLRIATHAFTASAGVLSITTSVGLACLPDTTITHLDALIKRADTALYAAKQAGRNCVMVG
ncbi:MAG: diguanylate cyclase [Chloroflexaceae bacterium]|nr:diguanylate cyclase [Chloroflexaceae bacterium]